MAVTGSLHTDYELSNKYNKPNSGIPASDMDSAVQTSLGKADTAYQKPQSGIPASDIESGVIPDVSLKVDASMMQKCSVDGVASSANLWNKDNVITGLLYKNGTVYTGGSYDNYRYNVKPISVSKDDVISFYTVGSSGSPTVQEVQYIACYDESGNINSSAGIANVLIQTYTVPDNVTSIVISAHTNFSNFMVLKNAEQAPTEYIPYHEDRFYVATDAFIPADVRQQLLSGKQDAPATAGLSGQVLIINSNGNPEWVYPSSLTFSNLSTAGDLNVGGGTLTLGTGANAVSITRTQLSDLLNLSSATGVSF